MKFLLIVYVVCMGTVELDTGFYLLPVKFLNAGHIIRLFTLLLVFIMLKIKRTLVMRYSLSQASMFANR